MRRQAVVAIVAALVVGVLLSVLLIRPKMSEVRDARKQVETAQREEIELRATLAQLKQAQREAPAIQARLAQFELLLPSSPDLPSFIRQVQGAANTDGVDLASIAPSPPTVLTAVGTASGVSTITVTLNVSGGFFRMESFLARLEELQRVVEVRNLSLSPKVDEDTGERSLQGTITLVMYVAEPGARPPTARPAGTATPAPTASPGSAATSPTPTAGATP